MFITQRLEWGCGSGNESPLVSDDKDLQQCLQSLDLGGQTEQFDNGNHRKRHGVYELFTQQYQKSTKRVEKYEGQRGPQKKQKGEETGFQSSRCTMQTEIKMRYMCDHSFTSRILCPVNMTHKEKSQGLILTSQFPSYVLLCLLYFDQSKRNAKASQCSMCSCLSGLPVVLCF